MGFINSLINKPSQHRENYPKELFIQFIVGNSASIASVKLENKEINEEQYFYVLIECLYFFLHVTDRMASSIMTHECRHNLMQEIAESSIMLATQSSLGHWPEDMKNKIFKECMQNYYDAMEEYSQYQYLIEKSGDSPKNTVLWEFGKKIARFSGNENNLGYLVGFQYVIVTALKNLDIKSFLNMANENLGN